jgi:uncharacterized protein YprB with RNaseH-like and TPR domain
MGDQKKRLVQRELPGFSAKKEPSHPIPHVDSLLTSHFDIFKGIGPKTDMKLRALGYHSWDHIFTRPWSGSHTPAIFRELVPKIKRSLSVLRSNDYARLGKLIDRRQHWRIIPHILDKIGYLDIETTGLDRRANIVTTIAVYYQNRLYNFVNGDNLAEFPAFIEKLPVLGTYYGSGFDIPFLRHYFGIEFPQLHLDLCPLFRRIGLTGGLKQVELTVGLVRPDVEDIDGECAVYLWNRYQHTRDRAYLATLLAYNNWDVLNLAYLLPLVYNRLVQQYQFETPLLPLPIIENPGSYHPDPAVLRELAHRTR